MLIIPNELKSVFDKYRGTGKFTVGAVSEFVHRWNVIRTAKKMDLQEWIGYAIDLSEKNDYIHESKRDYIDSNIDFWIDTWRYANDDMVHFSRKNVEPFVSEQLIELAGRNLYNYSNGKEESRKSEWIFDLVKYKV